MSDKPQIVAHLNLRYGDAPNLLVYAYSPLRPLRHSWAA